MLPPHTPHSKIRILLPLDGKCTSQLHRDLLEVGRAQVPVRLLQPRGLPALQGQLCAANGERKEPVLGLV